jgi:hypothetical protein
MIEFGSNIFNYLKNKRLDSQASRVAKKQYLSALDNITFKPMASFGGFALVSEDAKQILKFSLAAELKMLGARKQAGDIMRAGRGKSEPQKLTDEEMFRYRK